MAVVFDTMPAMSVSSTINQTSLEDTYPSILRRFAIINYDLLLLLAVSMAYGLIYIGISKLVFGIEADRATGIVFQLGWLLSLFGFYAYFWIRGGQTTGMRAWRVQIVNLENKAPSLLQCCVRFILSPLGWLLFITSFFDDKKQCLHDKLSKTQLILLSKTKK
jgi:uncharacterized RDD family membrane protein YckC